MKMIAPTLVLVAAMAVFAGCQSRSPDTSGAAASRGFNEPTYFARSLEANPRTADAGDRADPTYTVIHVWSEPDEIRRHSTRSFTVEIPRQPLLARLSMEVWQQGTDKKPDVLVNDSRVGELEVAWPSLAHRNFVFFAWDDEEGGHRLAYDYQGWLDAAAFIDGSHFPPGIHRIGLRVDLDQIKFRRVTLELLYGLDADDTVYDFRRQSAHEPLPYME